MSSRDRTTLVLTRSDVARLLDLPACIAAVENALLAHARGESSGPLVSSLHERAGAFHLKAARIRRGRAWFAAKCNANYPDNPRRHDLPTVQGLVILCDADDGRMLAVLDATEITLLRTAAATAIAARHLARADTRTATILGCGLQGRVHARALVAVSPLETLLLHDVVPARAAALAAELRDELPCAVRAIDDPRTAIATSDVVVACTTSREPLFDAAVVRAGTFVAGVGADNPHKQEIDPRLFSRSKVVVDHLEQCAAMGDLHHALVAGVATRECVHAELAELVAGTKVGRASPSEITLFDSTGVAIEDVAAAATVYERALADDAGSRVSFGS
jgi:ornithine cyclodeaminase/alanine dehydrogenase-like protein (mu-crystallin family)